MSLYLFTDLALSHLHTIDEDTMLDISTSEYADLISIRMLLESEPDSTYGQVKLMKDTSIMNKARAMTQDESIGILYLYFQNDTRLLLVLDTDREINIHLID